MRELEERFADCLVVIGVHSAKFTAESVFANLRQAVLRYDIRHPVLNDAGSIVWQEYAVSAWPTTVVIDPAGRVVGEHVGEFEAGQMAAIVQEIADEYDRQGKLDRTPVAWPLEKEREPARPLSFSGKVLADARSRRLLIADTAHHRILIATLDGGLIAVAGSGSPGLRDGDFTTASFHSPQGIALDGEVLYVADTGNHCIRRVDLQARQVERLAGTGEQARLARRGGPALQTALSSPWDIALRNGTLVIAMAGTHQLWELDLAVGEARRTVGTGREALHDDTLQRSALAQPSGLAVANGLIYFADSESSAIRVANLQADRVETLIGEGLFEFGDRDGQGRTVRLQHPLGIAFHDHSLYVADTYNNKINYIVHEPPTTETFAGTGEADHQDGPGDEARFWEPGGLSIANGRLYVADTNNHAIRVVDLDTREVQTLSVGEA